MPKRSRKPKEDINQIAARIVAVSTGDKIIPLAIKKNPAAVELGRLGGLRGGKARAEKLSKARRSEIARKAAIRRWAARKL